MCAGCTFADFDGYRVAHAVLGATVSLVDCSFEGNRIFPVNSGAAVIDADGASGFGNTKVRLEGCTFSSNSPTTMPTLLADFREAATDVVVFYSNSASPPVCTYKGPDFPSPLPPCEISSPLSLAQAGSRFLTASDAFLLEAQEVCFALVFCCNFASTRIHYMHDYWTCTDKVATRC